MKRVLVTGAEGKLGHFVVEELSSSGYTVIGTDNRPPSGKHKYAKYMQGNLSRLGEVYGILAESRPDALVHLAAIPNPVSFSPEYIFSNNVMSCFHVLEAASKLGIRRVVIGSSESAYGFCWAKHPFSPDYFPVDEDHRLLPQESYGLSKVTNEWIGDMFTRREGMEVFGLRFALILAPEEYVREKADFSNTDKHHRILWSYVDARDAAAACRLAVEAPYPGDKETVRLDITGSDLLSDQELHTLVKRYYPEVPYNGTSPEQMTALVTNRRAQEVLGWKPVYSWREEADKHSEHE